MAARPDLASAGIFGAGVRILMRAPEHPCASSTAHHRPPNAVLFLLLAALGAACADPATSIDREAVDRAALSVDAATEFVINDEQWIDRTVEEESVEIPVADSDDAGAGDAPSDAAQALVVEAEPLIRVGVVYSELNATSVRLGGRDNADPYSLRSGSVTGTVLAAGITGGEVVATRLASGPSMRLTLPGGATITPTNAVALVSASGFARVRRTTGDASIYRGAAEIRFNSTKAALVGVNVLPIEQYVYGVVPRELPPVPYGQPEAQKSWRFRTPRRCVL